MIRVLGDKIAVKHIQEAGKIGLLYIPTNTASHRNQTYITAEVVSNGAKVKTAIKGKKVQVSEHAGDAVKVNGVEYRILRERDIVGVMQ